jgi:putative transposase
MQPNRVYRLMRTEGLRVQRGYKRHRGYYGGTPSHVAPNHLQRQFDVARPNECWVTDITYIRTHEGFLYLATVMDLFSRQIVGWSMRSGMTTDLVMNALSVFRSRGSIHEPRVAQFHSRSQSLAKHESSRQLSRQCSG